ncbi:MAG TPA: class I SAM-dependent methyltransferase [Planctomycetaceae bacterium]|nr:class I SAM-dependent methyltransferase [Planctomycetaceae bacterium]
MRFLSGLPLSAGAVVSWLLWLAAAVCGQQAGAPKGLAAERELPSRYPFVVEDLLRHCNPSKGFWIDLGAGKGQIALELVKATGNPVVMLDPDVEAMQEGLAIARREGLGNRVFAVVGVAENLPFPDNSVDLVASRGSIFFWDDPVKGLKEVYRVLRPGGKAYIGGGAGSGYPKWAVKRLIAGRVEKLEGDERERWKRFLELRRPEQMRRWAEDAGLTNFQVFGEGAISDADPRVGQGVWLLFEKAQDVSQSTAKRRAGADYPQQ